MTSANGGTLVRLVIQLRGATEKTKDVFCEGITRDEVTRAVVPGSGER